MKGQGGFTLIEILIALGILLIVIVGLVSTTSKSTHVAAISERESAAIELVHDRIDRVRVDPDYGGLDTTYAKTETSFPTLAGFQRVTTIVRFTSSSNDYKKVTVTVTGPGLPAAGISRTITVAAP
jgi:prepilin-type N-terminal cleavage/methylation domain-containing protein